jgi:arylsulfatase A-like enzyme
MPKEDNVILITIDSLRVNHLNLCGYKKETTPNLDLFVKESVFFSEAVSNGSYTAISVPAILTSAYGSMYGGYRYLSDERISIAECLSKEGYSTAAFHSNPYLSAIYNYNRYYDEFYDSIHSRTSPSLLFKMIDRLANLSHEKNNIKTLLPPILKLFSYVKPYKMPYENGGVITKRAMNWLKRCDKKFLLWIHYMDTHWPWLPHQSFDDESVKYKEAFNFWWKMLIDPSSISNRELGKLIELYDEEIKYVDAILGKFFYMLKKMNIYDDSLIIVMSDHGEEFREHGNIGHHSFSLYEELIHVPLIIKFPHGVYGGATVDNLVSSLDVAPTIVNWLNFDIPNKWIGKSLIPILANKEEVYNYGVISEGKIKKGQNILSYRTKRWKYIYDETREGQELYDLRNDPKEKKNLSDMMPKLVREFETEIHKHLSMPIKRSVLLKKIKRTRMRLKKNDISSVLKC